MDCFGKNDLNITNWLYSKNYLMSSSTIKPDERLILNGLQLIQKESPPPGQAYTVVVYILTNTIGTNGERGMIFIIGSYPSAKGAVDKAKEIVDKTGITGVYALPTCKWEDIDTKYRPDRTIYVEPSKLNKKLDSFWSRSIETQESERTYTEPSLKDPEPDDWRAGTLDHYTRLWYLLIKNKTKLNDLKQQVKHYETMLTKRADELQLVHKEHPEFESQWLSGVERRLKSTGEADLLTMIKNGHQELVKEVLPD